MIAIRPHPGIARDRATASAMQDTKSLDRWNVPLIALWLLLLAVLIAGLDERSRPILRQGWGICPPVHKADPPSRIHLPGYGCAVITQKLVAPSTV